MTLEPIKIDYVLHPQAVALKELGFNEPCLFPFYHNGETIDCIYADLCNYNAGNLISAPTYSQAFRFFRKQYKLNHSIETGSDAMKYATLLYESRPQIAYIYTSDEKIYMGEYAEYEEAELACLKELIKIVKNKKP